MDFFPLYTYRDYSNKTNVRSLSQILRKKEGEVDKGNSNE